LVKFTISGEAANWKAIGGSLKGGELVLSPFESPVEEELRGDPDQTDDDQNYAQGSYICESQEPNLQTLTKPVTGVARENRFRYFLDGSIRTKYVGEYVTGSGGFPIVVSEIVVAVVRRDDRTIQPQKLMNRVFLVFPHKDSGLVPDGVFDLLEKMQAKFEAADGLTQIDFMKKASVSPNIRASLLAKVRGVMHDMEHRAAESLTRSDKDWLIMDGAVRSFEFAKLRNTIGLAKSFSRKPILEAKGAQRTIPAYMRHLKAGERSHVFRIVDPSNPLLRDVTFWYLRLRVFPPMEPLGGIVKIDLHLDTVQNGLDEGVTKMVDEISSEIYSMRLPSVYPWPRWPSYIYPIRVAETYMTSSFFSPFVLARVGNVMKDAMETS
jgi:hypothetical protein